MSSSVSSVRTKIKVPSSNPSNLAVVASDGSQYCELEFKASKASINAANHPVLAQLSRTNPDIGDNMGLLYQELYPYQDKVMQWMQDDPANAQAFAEDPLKAFQRATGAPNNLLNKIAEMQKQWPVVSENGQDEYVNQELHTLVDTLAQDFAQGWDIVSAIRQKELNNGLTIAYSLGLMPKDFDAEYKIKFGPITIPIKIKGTFAATQVKSGTGSNIDLIIPIKSGTIRFQDQEPGFDLTGVQVVMTVNLVYVKSPVQPEKGHKYEFQIDISNTEAFVGIDLEKLPKDLIEQKTALETALLELLRKQIPGHPYKVFEITLEGIDEDYPYLIPSLVQYAFINDSKNPDDNVLGALTLTTGKVPGVDQLLMGTVPNDCRAALIISNQLFMEKVVLPQVISGMKVDSSYFQVSGSPAVIQNTKSFDYYEKVKGYTPKVTLLKIQISDNAFTIDMKLTVTPSPGINIDYWVHGEYTFKITTQDDKQIISYEQKSYSSGHGTTVEWWVWLVAVLAGMIFGIIGAVIAVIIVLIIQAVVNASSPDPEANMFLKALKPITWNYVGLFEMKQINLPGPIQVGGNVPILAN
ncbi:MAG: hypothetical protein CVU90_08255 [Firmicutes bacterium HGW-Firmicutes-15]|nr:MAG: hypothetical protein CVU90_08255 [Firmicutes bacterium HGW-Firmicutes-15]